MNMFYAPVFIDDDADGNRIEVALGENGINSLDNVFFGGVVLDADWQVAGAGARCDARFQRQFHLVEVLNQVLDELGVAAVKNKFQHMAADLCCQNAPMEFGNGRTVVKAHERVASDTDLRGWAFHFVVRWQMALRVIDQFRRIAGWGRREEEVLRDDQKAAASCSLGGVRRPELC